MEISNELRSRILTKYHQCKPKLDECVIGKNFESKFVLFPIYIDGVFDQVRYNVEEGRFDQIAIRIATKGIVGAFRKWSVWCDETKEVIIPLEEECTNKSTKNAI